MQQVYFEYMDTNALASQSKLISCFGNNAGSGYLAAMIPPAPNQDPAPATETGKYSRPAEEPSALYDASAENAPANPYFSPIGWTFKLRQDEAAACQKSLFDKLTRGTLYCVPREHFIRAGNSSGLPW